jgi:Ca2+-binding EF-hand superfamily protein
MRPPTPRKRRKREKRFTKMDRNRGSSVDREELTESRIAEKKPERAVKRFSRVDESSDGKLTKEEWSCSPGEAEGEGRGLIEAPSVRSFASGRP